MKIANPRGDGKAFRAIGIQRIGALNKLFAHRYGGARHDYVFPDDDAGLEDLKILLHHYCWNNPLAMTRVIELRAPWVNDKQAANLIEQVEFDPLKWRSETLGKLLNFTGREWRQLRIRTITPVDMSRDERRYYSEVLRKARRKIKRVLKGGKPRATYEGNSLSRTKPWVAQGISRTTWYERRMR
jgi:hypothetical protein